jgi:hypothetical protein
LVDAVGDTTARRRFHVAVRWSVGLSALLLVACATTKRSEDPLKATCREDMDADARCVELLTGSGEREAEEEVLRAEEDRERDAFRARLERLRAAEEKRQARRVKSSTVAQMEVWEEEDNEAWLELLSARSSDEDEDSGSSVRALKAAPAAPPPRPEAPSIQIVTPPSKLEAEDAGPDAATYLAGSWCLLRTDLVLMRQTLETAKKNTSKGDLAGSQALVILDAEGLLARVERARKANKLEATPLCSSGDTRSMVNLLRELVGPRPKATEAGDAYGRGLVRLAAELEKRARLAGSQ